MVAADGVAAAVVVKAAATAGVVVTVTVKGAATGADSSTGLQIFNCPHAGTIDCGRARFFCDRRTRTAQTGASHCRKYNRAQN
jgi:hypothetical protein